MSRKEDIFRSVLTSAYDHGNFVDFTREIITGLSLGPYTMASKPWNTFSAFISQYFTVGEFTDPEDNRVGVFAVELLRGESVDRARTAQRNFVKTLLERGGYAAALVAFYSTDTDKWRFSFVRMDYEFAKGKIKESLTPARRYSYLVGKGEPCHTAMDRLLPIFMDDSRVPTIDEIEEAFSVEKVTKDFFEAYKEKYLQLAEYLNNNEEFVRESTYKGFTTEQFTKKLLSQIVFLYFIQKKGWLGVNAVPRILTEKQYKNAFFSHGSKSRELVGKVYYQQGDEYKLNVSVLRSLSDEDENEFSKCVKGQPWGTGPKDFMRRIFQNAVNNNENFFDDCLEPLFYTGLNKDRGENAFFPPLHCRIPFLNGGLFEELDHYDWQHNDFGIPNEIFSNVDEKGREADGILDIFDRYNFTMAEDEPLEKEVAVDPEMLGKVFENLLEVKDRKSKGAFYTPREIVHYMCSESLINYLVTSSGIPEEDIRKFITLGEFFKDEDARKTVYDQNAKKYLYDYNKQLEMPASILDFKNNVNRLNELDTLLSSVRVVDPAVGSGAFPLGLLNEIVKARDTITTYMAIPMSGFQRKLLHAQRSPYQLKTQTIKNCIYACDIEPSATDITKLRLWLALVIEDEIGDQDSDEFGEHTKPRKLPNLDCNVLCGNSLNDTFEGIKLICNTETLGNQKSGTNISMADKLIEGHINSLIELQDRLYNASSTGEKDEIKKNIQVLYDAIIMEQLQTNPDAMHKYSDPEIRHAASKPFILWQLYFPKVFKDKGGFDICIGNPPYVNIVNLDAATRNLLKNNYSITKNKVDLYAYFVELALRIVNKKATVSFIIPQTWKATDSFSLFRKMIFNNASLAQVVNMEYGTFDATVKPVIILLKEKMETNYPITIKDNAFRVIDTIDSIEVTSNPNYILDTESSREDKIMFTKIEGKNEPLGSILQFTRGIKTSNDKKFILNEKKNADCFKVYRGKNIKAYQLSWNNEYIWYRPDLMKEKAGCVPHSRELFDVPEKIVTQRVSYMQLPAALDTEQQFFLDTCIVSRADTLAEGYSIKYILALLNSKVVNYWYGYKYRMPTIGLYEMHSIPIPKPNSDVISALEELVDTISSTTDKTIRSNAINSIDEIVFDLYNLTKEDAAYIKTRI